MSWSSACVCMNSSSSLRTMIRVTSCRELSRSVSLYHVLQRSGTSWIIAFKSKTSRILSVFFHFTDLFTPLKWTAHRPQSYLENTRTDERTLCNSNMRWASQRKKVTHRTSDKDLRTFTRVNCTFPYKTLDDVHWWIRSQFLFSFSVYALKRSTPHVSLIFCLCWSRKLLSTVLFQVPFSPRPLSCPWMRPRADKRSHPERKSSFLDCKLLYFEVDFEQTARPPYLLRNSSLPRSHNDLRTDTRSHAGRKSSYFEDKV